ncbi:MAG: NADH-quinone oxidoreductase subunit J [Chloroflexi bacterium]|nr:NADH-quinone oxidoreductase subunit J [Chloroflexota bacterium]
MELPQTVPFLDWRWDDLIFLVLAGTMLGSALLVVVGRDIIRSGLFMVLAFGALAGLYALMGATLVAAAQVLVYLGAISVLILFAIMLTQSKAGPVRLVFHSQAWAAAIAAIVIGGLLIASVLLTSWPLAAAEPIVQTARDVAALMFGDYVLAFEVISVLLLAAVVGGIFLARRDDIPDPSDPATRIEDGSASRVTGTPGVLGGPARPAEKP